MNAFISLMTRFDIENPTLNETLMFNAIRALIDIVEQQQLEIRCLLAKHEETK